MMRPAMFAGRRSAFPNRAGRCCCVTELGARAGGTCSAMIPRCGAFPAGSGFALAACRMLTLLLMLCGAMRKFDGPALGMEYVLRLLLMTNLFGSPAGGGGGVVICEARFDCCRVLRSLKKAPPCALLAVLKWCTLRRTCGR